MFISCTSTKSLTRDKTKVESEQIQSGEQVVKRASDTILMTIPTIKYKDTIIYKRGRKSTVYINYETKINGSFILYIFLGLAFLIIIFKLSNRYL